MRSGEIERTVIVLRRDIFCIGLVDHQQNVGGKSGMKTRQLVPGRKLPVGLFGLAMNTTRVFAFTAASSASTSVP